MSTEFPQIPSAGKRRRRGIGLGRLSLRARVGLLAALVVVMTIVLASVASYQMLSAQLRGEVDRTLVAQAARFSASDFAKPDTFAQVQGAYTALGINIALVTGDRAIGFRGMRPPVPLNNPQVAADIRAAQSGSSEIVLRDAHSDGVHVRVATAATEDGYVVVLVRSLTTVDQTLTRLGLIMAAIGIGGVALAVTAGVAIARAGLAPVRRLSETAGRIARTQELDTEPIEAGGNDEIARLAESFNAMLGALEVSRQRQRQLVADASHELRTPLTSLRTNIGLLIQSQRDSSRTISPEAHRALLADVEAQLAEMSQLIDDLVELAREEPRTEAVEPVELDAVTRHAVERVRRRAPGISFAVDLRPWMVRGSAAELERAVINLLDNAVKFSPEGGEVGVLLQDGRLTVQDQGPGIADEDLPHVFDRFYRSTTARSLPGSGLGLAIVRRVAEHHGGSVAAYRGPAGGTLMVLVLPAWQGLAGP